jgi:hypothetical protein
MIGSMGPARSRQFGLSSYDQLFDPLTNAKAAVAISGGGKDFGPWSTYGNGAYRSHLQGGVAPDSSGIPNATTGGSGDTPGMTIPADFATSLSDWIVGAGSGLASGLGSMNPFTIIEKGVQAMVQGGSGGTQGGILAPITGPFIAIGTAAAYMSKIMNVVITHLFLPATWIRIACFYFGFVLIIAGLFIFFTGRIPNPIHGAENVAAVAAKVVK